MSNDDPDLSPARRYRWMAPRPGAGSPDSSHSIALAIGLDRGDIKIEDVPKNELMNVVSFAAAAGADGVSPTYYRDLVERNRNQVVCDIRDLKSIEEEFAKRADAGRSIAKWLASALRSEETARKRGRPSPPHPNPQVAQLVGQLFELEFELIEMGTRTRDPSDPDKSLFLREGQLFNVMRRPKTA